MTHDQLIQQLQSIADYIQEAESNPIRANRSINRAKLETLDLLRKVQQDKNKSIVRGKYPTWTTVF